MTGGGDESGEELPGRESRRWAGRGRGRGVPRVMLGGEEGKGTARLAKSGRGFGFWGSGRGEVSGVGGRIMGAANMGSGCGASGWGPVVAVSTAAGPEGNWVSGKTGSVGWSSFWPFSSTTGSAGFVDTFRSPGNNAVLCDSPVSASLYVLLRRFAGLGSFDASEASLSLLLAPACCWAESNWAWMSEYKPFSERKS